LNPPGDTLLLRNSPDRRDDRVEPLFATDFSERDRNHCLRAIEERFVAGKWASEGATVFMKNSGQ